jgi:hypothetical protein
MILSKSLVAVDDTNLVALRLDLDTSDLVHQVSLKIYLENKEKLFIKVPSLKRAYLLAIYNEDEQLIRDLEIFLFYFSRVNFFSQDRREFSNNKNFTSHCLKYITRYPRILSTRPIIELLVLHAIQSERQNLNGSLIGAAAQFFGLLNNSKNGDQPRIAVLDQVLLELQNGISFQDLKTRLSDLSKVGILIDVQFNNIIEKQMAAEAAGYRDQCDLLSKSIFSQKAKSILDRSSEEPIQDFKFAGSATRTLTSTERVELVPTLLRMIGSIYKSKTQEISPAILTLLIIEPIRFEAFYFFNTWHCRTKEIAKEEHPLVDADYLLLSIVSELVLADELVKQDENLTQTIRSMFSAVADWYSGQPWVVARRDKNAA